MKKILIALSLILLLNWMPTQAHAQSGISEKLNQSLDAMANYTPPGVEEANRRTVITGGSLTVKMKTGAVEGFAFRPPSISVGCGGIDAFFGAFSMISKEVLVQALRAIVTGALQYAFRIALKVLCQSCEQIMADISKMLADANRWLGDMCNTTSNFLESQMSSSEAAAKIRAQYGNTETGVAEDNASSNKWGEFTSAWDDFFKYNEDKVPATIPEYGNQLYNKLKDGEDNTFYWLSAQEPFYEEMISLIGTVIVCSTAEADCPQPSTDSDVIARRQEGDTTYNIYKPVMSFETLVTGETAVADDDGNSVGPAMWKCDTTSGKTPCKTLSPGTMDNFVSMSERLRKAFLGSDGNPGIIYKVRYSPQAPMTAEEELWMKAGGPVVGQVLDLATKDTNSARGWVMDYSDAIAADFTFSMMNEFMTKIRQTTAMGQMSTMHEQVELIDQAFLNMRADYMKISAQAQDRGVAFEAYRARAAQLAGR